MTLTTWTPGRVGEKNEANLTSQMAPRRFAKRTLPDRVHGFGPTAPAFTPLEEPDVGILLRNGERRRRGRPPHVEVEFTKRAQAG